MTKTLNEIIFFPPPKSEYFFQQQRESEYFFRRKSLRNFSSDNTRVRILLFSQNLALGYMTKTRNQITFFPPPKSEYFFQQHWESEYFLSHEALNLFPEFNMRLYDKNSESDYFFSSTKIRIFFSATLGIRIFF
jgi:hypothetical protein